MRSSFIASRIVPAIIMVALVGGVAIAWLAMAEQDKEVPTGAPAANQAAEIAGGALAGLARPA